MVATGACGGRLEVGQSSESGPDPGKESQRGYACNKPDWRGYEQQPEDPNHGSSMEEIAPLVKVDRGDFGGRFRGEGEGRDVGTVACFGQVSKRLGRLLKGCPSRSRGAKV
ncbi:hypothetical protein WMY93_031460 [Mugilogobius chulae]|uniref:Uncharacterized protein n=1 Tax=Mugilogobius chulae TaxID=88201 RepID=A0AAW0MFW6_9GOBI